jgi:hypothetical protein
MSRCISRCSWRVWRCCDSTCIPLLRCLQVRTASCAGTACVNSFGDEQLAVDMLADKLLFEALRYSVRGTSSRQGQATCSCCSRSPPVCSRFAPSVQTTWQGMMHVPAVRARYWRMVAARQLQPCRC